MKVSSHKIAGLFGLAASFCVLVGTWVFPLMRPGYSHISHTISELGETGTPLTSLVSYGFFLPTGLLVWLAIFFAYPLYSSDRLASVSLWAFSALGLGYVMSAFFPCDPGSPLIGSWSQQVHNFFGFIEYLGTGVGLIIFGRSRVVASPSVRIALKFSGFAVLLTLVLLAIPSLFSLRGVIQRVSEFIMFAWVTVASLWLILRYDQPNPAR